MIDSSNVSKKIGIWRTRHTNPLILDVNFRGFQKKEEAAILIKLIPWAEKLRKINVYSGELKISDFKADLGRILKQCRILSILNIMHFSSNPNDCPQFFKSILKCNRYLKNIPFSSKDVSFFVFEKLLKVSSRLQPKLDRVAFEWFQPCKIIYNTAPWQRKLTSIRYFEFDHYTDHSCSEKCSTQWNRFQLWLSNVMDVTQFTSVRLHFWHYYDEKYPGLKNEMSQFIEFASQNMGQLKYLSCSLPEQISIFQLLSNKHHQLSNLLTLRITLKQPTIIQLIKIMSFLADCCRNLQRLIILCEGVDLFENISNLPELICTIEQFLQNCLHVEQILFFIEEKGKSSPSLQVFLNRLILVLAKKRHPTLSVLQIGIQCHGFSHLDYPNKYTSLKPDLTPFVPNSTIRDFRFDILVHNKNIDVPLLLKHFLTMFPCLSYFSFIIRGGEELKEVTLDQIRRMISRRKNLRTVKLRTCSFPCEMTETQLIKNSEGLQVWRRHKGSIIYI